MARISNMIGLAKVSWGVFLKGRDLLVLPILSFLVSTVVLVALGWSFRWPSTSTPPPATFRQASSSRPSRRASAPG